jgi:tyrosine-protein kinase Etk/Wzc
VATEAFRNLRTAIHFSGLKRGKQVILSTSSFPGEGKTTVSANLATVLAQAGSRILLVGCDMRKPTLHKMFGRTQGSGLTELLAGDAQLAETIFQTDVPGLDFVGGGAIPPNPAELLGSEQMSDFIEQVKERYDHIILDAPPFLAVSDGALLSRLANMVLVVMEAGRVPTKVLRHLSESLKSCDAPVAGVVLNDKAGRAASYYGGYGYGQYGYGYGYSYGANENEAVQPSWAQRLLARMKKKNTDVK